MFHGILWKLFDPVMHCVTRYVCRHLPFVALEKTFYSCETTFMVAELG